MAQLGVPDMRVPIIYALDYPKRFPNNVKPLDFMTLNALTFSKPDLSRFPCLGIAIDSLRKGGVAPTVMNAANEVLVDAYLKDQIGFYDISDSIQKVMAEFETISHPNIEQILWADQETRERVSHLLKR